MNLKQNRHASFIIIALIYVSAAVAGIGLYLSLPFTYWQNLLIADAAATAVVFAFSLILSNASVYDPYWSVQPVVILAALSLEAQMTLPRMFLLFTVCLWGIRLTANWAYTFNGLLYQDWRYTMLKERTGKAFPVVSFSGIHMMPTLIVFGCIMPAVFVFRFDARPNAGSIIFIFISIAAAVLQGVSDLQMHKFRKSRRGGFLRTGLWKYSRHPNYLGEILMWWGVALSALCLMPGRWYLAAGAAANTLLFLFVSIPLADNRQAQKEGFEEYRRQTRMLLPIRKKL